MFYRVIQLTVCVGYFFPVYDQLKALHQPFLGAVLLGQRAHLHRVVGDEGRLYVVLLALAAKYLVHQFTLTHRCIHIYVQLLAHPTQAFLVHSAYVYARMLLYGIVYAHAAVWRLKVYFRFINRGHARAIGSYCRQLQHLLRCLHHPQIVLVGHIKFQYCKLRIVCPVHTFIAEVAAELIYPLKTAYYQALQVQLIGYTQVQRHIQCIMMGNEWLGQRTARYALQHRRIHLQRTLPVQEVADGILHLRYLYERIPYPRIHDQVGIALAIFKLQVRHRVKHLSVLFLRYRHRVQALGQQYKRGNVYRCFTHLGDKPITLHPYYIPYVQQLFPHLVIHHFVIAGA